ncbi:MAG: hypothetical protein ALAOOOJD_04451 [bacterium]|nr:hypothetical protein [bacterium]
MRVIEPRFLNIQHRRADEQLRAQAAITELVVGTAGFIQNIRNADLRRINARNTAAAFEASKIIAWLRNLPTRQRQDKRQHAFAQIIQRGRRHRVNHLRLAVAAVTFPQDIILGGNDAVVVGGAAPQQRCRRHHALLDIQHFLGVAGGASLIRHAEIPGIDEANEFGFFLIQQRKRARRIRRRRPAFFVARLDVRFALRSRLRIAAVAIRAAQLHCRRFVHTLDPGMTLQTTFALAVGLFLRLANKFVFLGDADARIAEYEPNHEKNHPPNGNDTTNKIHHLLFHPRWDYQPLAAVGKPHFFHPKKILPHPNFLNQ